MHVAFLGGQSQTAGGYIHARFAAYAVTKGAREDERRRGNPREIGAYEIIERLATQLEVLDVPDIGDAKLEQLRDLVTV